MPQTLWESYCLSCITLLLAEAIIILPTDASHANIARPGLVFSLCIDKKMILSGTQVMGRTRKAPLIPTCSQITPGQLDL